MPLQRRPRSLLLAELTISSGVGLLRTRGSRANSAKSSAGRSCGGANSMRFASPATRRMASRRAEEERSMTSTVATAAVAAATKRSISTEAAVSVSFAVIVHDASNRLGSVLCRMSQIRRISGNPRDILRVSRMSLTRAEERRLGSFAFGIAPPGIKHTFRLPGLTLAKVSLCLLTRRRRSTLNARNAERCGC